MNELKQDLWSKASVGIPHLDIEANDAVLLGYQVAEFLSEVNLNYFMILMTEISSSMTMLMLFLFPVQKIRNRKSN